MTRLASHLPLLLASLALAACAGGPALVPHAVERAPTGMPVADSGRNTGAGVDAAEAASAAAPALVGIDTRVPDIDQDIRYAGSRNFTGGPVDGYDAPRCLLLAPVADALARVEAALRRDGLRLRIFDCYRPQRAVAHFMRWARDLDDTATQAAYYPRLRKQDLVPDYIAERSGHSRGATVDATLLSCDASGTCVELDMGTPFDFFDTRANTDDPRVTPAQGHNRALLRAAMAAGGFANYPMEWWHFTLKPEPSPDRAFDVPVR